MQCEEDRREEGKAVGESFYPLADVPDIQKEFLRQLEEGGPTDNLPDQHGREETATAVVAGRVVILYC